MKQNPSLEELQAIMNKNGGWLDLRGTQITKLPDNLTVGGWLYLSGSDRIKIGQPKVKEKWYNDKKGKKE